MTKYELKMLDSIKEISRSSISFDEKLQKAKELKEKEPSSRWVLLFYSTLLADNSQYMKSGWEIDLREAVATLSSLRNEVSDMPEDFQLRVHNEYYYHSKQYLKQYELGLTHYRKYKNIGAYFSCAVGATMLAHTYFENGNVEQGQEWAKEGLGYCRQYEDLKPQGAHNICYFTVICLKHLSGKNDALEYLNSNPNLSNEAREEVQDYLTNTWKIL